MKVLLTAMTAVAAMSVGAPAAAQYGYQPNVNVRGAVSFDDRIAQLETRLEAGIRSGSIDRREAYRLRHELGQLRELERQYSRRGISQQQHADLQERLRMVRQQIRTADRGSYDRYEQRNAWVDYDDYGRGQYGYQGNVQGSAAFDARMGQLETRLNAGIRAGTIDRREAVRLRNELTQLQRMERQYSRGGISGHQHADLQQRIGALRQQIRIADRGSYDRYERRADWAEYDGHYGQGGVYDPYGQGAYQDPCAARGGIGGFIEGIFGGGGGSDCLQVGQRVSGNLYGVPSELRHQYRDGGGVYYRSDGRVIYGIDARTHTVVRVYPIHR
jgi:hypothetical protein